MSAYHTQWTSYTHIFSNQRSHQKIASYMLCIFSPVQYKIWKATIQRQKLQPFKSSKASSTHGKRHRNREILPPRSRPCYNCSKNTRDTTQQPTIKKRPPQEQQAPTVTSKGAQLGTITKGAPQGTITKCALHERRHAQELISHRTRAKKAKPSHADTNPIASHTRSQTTSLEAHIMAQEATDWSVLNKNTGKYMTCAQLRRHPQHAKSGTSPLPTKWADFSWE